MVSAGRAEKGEAPAGGRRSMGVILVTGLLAFGIGAAGAFFGAKHLLAPGAAPEAEAASEHGEEAEAAHGTEESAGGQGAAGEFQERLLSLEPMVLNVSGDGYGRLLKLRVQFECESKAVREEAEARIPQIQDSIVTLVSSKRLSDVTSFEGKALLKEDLLSRVNQLLSSGKVRSVLLTEFVVQ